MQFDSNIVDFFSSRSSDGFLTAVLKFLSIIGSYGIPWVFFIIVFLIKPQQRRNGIILAAAMTASLLINNVLIKNVTARLRPFVVDPTIVLSVPVPFGYSFASGHASASFAASVGISKANKLHALWSFPLAAAISFSRIYFSVHYFSDVIAGIIIGMICGYIGIKIEPIIYKLSNHLISKSKNRKNQ